MTRTPPRILAIAGSDSSGGAGIQADIKTIAMLGGYAMTAITTVTAQNTVGVQAIAPMSGDVVAEQIRSCLSDIGADAIKVGMVHDLEIIEGIAGALDALPEGARVVLDPVMIATSGAALIAPEAIAALKERLFPLATVITPNFPELEHLAGRTLPDRDEIAAASLALAQQYGCAVLAKGGHAPSDDEGDDRIVDLLMMPDGEFAQFADPRIATVHTHGTGCTLSSAIATLLGHGLPLEHSVRLARQFVRRAIAAAPGFGRGGGPLGHQAVRGLD
ncbi:Hydroxymethylpyrimidine/phosphomethylpyrimidine kinase [Tsuneonella dongtanensis]|uniref:hydroxymethylpyrimidine kinase n=1 Tax=Tsuneonella dongtanensis TaxID=692370 RepID=A0A1B2AC24_9SPHN|nr:bifunctional hydroxymethylpyrimidine kinase/phosphomethylpyrimidine kinase [Tsuneonella dongtanensis]ANY19712.1 Hydroxymethylpyrimidine/phosphomethylpyrimidine kinase [Tsuneonella dongtanensis]